MWIVLFKKEIYLLGRAKNGLLSILSLSLSALFLFYFGFEDRNSLDLLQISAARWIILFLMIHILVGQSVWEERESEAYRIVHSYLPKYLPFLIKSFSLFLVLMFLLILFNITLALFFVKYKLEWSLFLHGISYISPSLLALVFIGIILSYLSQSTRLKEMLLPVLQTPLSIPIFLFGLEGEKKAILQNTFQYKIFFILILFCLLYGALGALILELNIEE